MTIESIKKNTFIVPIGILIISLILSALVPRALPQLPVVSDSADYHTIAVGMLTEGKYVSIPNQTLLIYPPLYPIFVACIYTVTHIGSYASVYMAQYAIVGMMAIIVFLILRRFSTASIVLSLVASSIVLFWPYLILYSQLISSEVIYSFFLLLFFLLFLSIHKRSKWYTIALTGIVLGIAILTRPVALLLLPWMLVFLLIASKMPRVFSIADIPWRNYFLILSISIVTLLPWEAYVHKHYNRIIPVASNLGNVFNKANKSFEYLPGTEKPNIIEAKIKNIYLFWDPGAGGYHLDILKKEYPLVGIGVILYKIIFFATLAVAIISAVLYRRNRLILYALGIITYTWALHTILFPFPRYTLPIMPFVIIVAVIGITYGTRKTETEYSHRPAGKE